MKKYTIPFSKIIDDKLLFFCEVNIICSLLRMTAAFSEILTNEKSVYDGY